MPDETVVVEEIRAPISTLRWLVDVYYQSQKLRIQIGNRLAALQRGDDAGDPPSSALVMFSRLEDAEAALVQDMADALEGHAAMRWLSGVKGIGPTLGAKLLGLIGDAANFDTVSKLWRFAGLAVIDGKRERPVKGEKMHYNKRLKSVLYLVATSFLKVKDSPYRAVYDRAREHYERIHPEQSNDPAVVCWTKGHQHLAAMRKMEKLFLSHLWQTWREASNLPVRDPYVLQQMGHTTFYDPWDFVTKTKKIA